MNKVPSITPFGEGETVRVPAARKRIFYVETDEDSATMMKVLLSQLGYDVTIARVWEDSIETLKKDRFDLIILGNWFEMESGLSLCRQIRANDQQIPIVVYSGAAYEDNIQEGMKAGADAYLLKPGGLSVIEETIARLVENKTMSA